MTTPPRLAVAVACLGLLASLARGGDVPPLATELVIDGFELPLFVTAPAGDDRLFVLEQFSGQVRIVSGGAILADAFLDLGGLITFGSERGLLGMAFDPAYDTTGRFYVFYNNAAGDTELARYLVDPLDPDRALRGSAEVLLTMAQPFPQHNGGMLAFSPRDGMLYVSTGDGGSGMDPMNNAQSLDTLLGKMLRLDVRGEVGYAVPPANPFVGTAGALPEIWHYGLRNPWRFSFDRDVGHMFIGDVGGQLREEIDVQLVTGPPGQNFGWVCREGTVELTPGCTTAGMTDPIVEFDHNTGCVVVGGYVYRGQAIPELDGTYFYGDYCTGRVWSFVLDQQGQASEHVERTAELNPSGGTLGLISSFGEDGFGELYIISRLTGALYRIVADVPDPDCDGDGTTDVEELAQGTAFDVNLNGTPDDCELLLSVTDIVQGGVSSFEFIGAQPGQPVAFFYSTRGAGQGLCFFADSVCLDILPSNVPGVGLQTPLLGVLPADAQGSVAFDVVVPDPVIGIDRVWFQNIVVDGLDSVKSNVVQREILD